MAKKKHAPVAVGDVLPDLGTVHAVKRVGDHVTIQIGSGDGPWVDAPDGDDDDDKKKG